MRGSSRLARLVPLAGVIFAVLTIAGYLTIGPFPDSDASVPELTSFYAANHGQVAAAGQLLGLAAIFLALFGTALWARLRSADLHPVVAGTALVATAMAAVSWLDGAGAYSILGEVGHQPWLPPAALQAIHVRGTVGGIDGGTVLFLLAVATAGIAGRAFPRWLASFLLRWAGDSVQREPAGPVRLGGMPTGMPRWGDGRLKRHESRPDAGRRVA